MKFFEQFESLPEDPILHLVVLINADKRENKINLGPGVYRTSELKPVVLSCVQKAEEELFQSNLYKEYPPIDGYKEYRDLCTQLVFGRESEACQSGRVYTSQTIGGSGALKVIAAQLAHGMIATIYVPDPTWANHHAIFPKSGIVTKTYSYYDYENNALDFSKMKEALNNMKKNSAVLLHCCCHNPTGTDLTCEQWKEVANIVKEKELLAVIDSAYQGFAVNLVADRKPIQHFAEVGLDFFVAHSFSKNMGLYGERIGAVMAVCPDKQRADTIGSRIRGFIRCNYSMPPIHGALLVNKVLGSTQLFKEWEDELSIIRSRISEMRLKFIESFKQENANKNLSFIKDGKGMFFLMGLEKKEVDTLIRDYAIYMPSNGRINAAALTTEKMNTIVSAINSVMH